MDKGKGIRLVVGLGNPGSRYADTRHNAGFWFVDGLASGQAFRPESKFMGQALRMSGDGGECWLFKPGAFMNRSGLPVKLIADYLKIPLNEILVAHDDLDLPAGAARVKWGGGHGGHNGLRDIFAHMGQDFWRLRIGVGHPGDRNKVIDYVLERPSKDDEAAINAALQSSLNVYADLRAGRFEKAMQALHGQQKGAQAPKES